MTLTLTLPPETEKKLRERAAHTGQEVVALARELIERGLVAAPTIDEILAPFRQDVAASGLSDAELDTLFEEEREAVWREGRGGEK
jgi:plasmid stability protein